VGLSYAPLISDYHVTYHAIFRASQTAWGINYRYAWAYYSNAWSP